MLTPGDIRDALRACYDPEIPLNIVDLGLIQTIALALDRNAPGTGIPGVPQRYSLVLTLISTSPEAAARAQLRAQIDNRLSGLPELSRVTIDIIDTPAWTPADITPEGRRALGLDQPQFPILNNRLR